MAAIPTRESRLDESELISAAKAGDRGAFDELVRRTFVDTFTLARRLTGNEEDGRDVVQDAYLRAFRGIGKFRGDAQFSTWMYRITANCAATHLGRRARHRHDDLDDETVLVDERPEIDPQAAVDVGQLRDQVQAEIAQLPPRLRAVVVL